MRALLLSRRSRRGGRRVSGRRSGRGAGGSRGSMEGVIAIVLRVAAGVGNIREGEGMVTKGPHPVLPE